MRKTVLIAMLAAPLPLWAGGAAGVWKTGADAKGQTAYVAAQPCGKALCGRITQVLSPDGRPIDHPNVGRQLFWDMVEKDAGTYEGRAYVPIMRRDYDATMKVSGQKMTVRGCVGPVCKSQVWTRVR